MTLQTYAPPTRLPLCRFVALAFVLVATSSCAQTTSTIGWWPFKASPPALAPGSQSKRIEPIKSAALAVVVDKSQRTLEVYRFGKLVRAYRITIGARPNGPKRYEGDMRTPEGFYHIVDKRPHRRWRYFLGIDYPNEEDVRRYAQDLARDLIPTIDGSPQGIGRALGIHGNDRAREQEAGRNWTHGCVAMANDDIAQLFKIIDIGTPVLMLP